MPCLPRVKAPQGDSLALQLWRSCPEEHGTHPKGAGGLLRGGLQILQGYQGVILLHHLWQPKLFRPPFSLSSRRPLSHKTGTVDSTSRLCLLYQPCGQSEAAWQEATVGVQGRQPWAVERAPQPSCMVFCPYQDAAVSLVDVLRTAHSKAVYSECRTSEGHHNGCAHDSTQQAEAKTYLAAAP